MWIQTIALIIFGNVCISAGICIKLTLVSISTMQVVVRLNLGFNLALADVDGNDCINGNLQDIDHDTREAQKINQLYSNQ